MHVARISNVSFTFFSVIKGEKVTQIWQFRSKQNTKHWKVLGDDNTLQRYSQPLHALIQSILLTLNGHSSGYNYPLSANMIAAAQRLLNGLNTSEGISSLLPKLHALVYLCFSPQPALSPYSKWNDVLECFMAIYALKEDGNFENGADLTNFFAILKYLCRSTILYQLIQAIADFDNDPVK